MIFIFLARLILLSYFDSHRSSFRFALHEIPLAFVNDLLRAKTFLILSHQQSNFIWKAFGISFINKT
jgi:hypothetical protein